MATIEITIPAGKLDRVIHGLCVVGGYIGEGEETAENAKKAVIAFIVRSVKNTEIQDAERAAAKDIVADDSLAT